MGSANDKLMGRVALAAKMLTAEQLTAATREMSRNLDDTRNIGQIFVDLGFVNETQLQKLVQMQKSVVAKAKAKRRADGPPTGLQPPPNKPAPPTTRPPTVTHAVERPFGGDGADASVEVGETSDVTAADSIAREAVGAPPGFETTALPVEPDAISEPVEPTARSARPSAAPGESPGDLDPALFGLMREAADAGASDLHVHSRAVPRFRVHGTFADHGDTPIAPEDAERMVRSMLTADQRRTFEDAGELDFSYTVDGIGRFRTNCYRQLRGVDVVMRLIPGTAPTLEELGLPSSLAKLTAFHQGMVLVTGPTSCGKSSTMAAFVNMINEERAEHVLTIEDPIEYLHPSKRCIVNQRNVHNHTQSFSRALRAALREDPDVIVIGELRDRETVSLAMTAAETGHFVLATLHTDNAVRTVNRILGSFPPDQQEQVRAMLSESLKAVISQRLLPRKDGKGLVPALEVMMVNRAVGNLIRDQKTIQIRSLLQTGQTQGMRLLDNSLAELVKAGTVDRDEAMRHVEDPKLIP